MGNEKRSEGRYGPRAGDLEGEPDEAFVTPAPPELEKGRVEPAEGEPRKKKHWWDQTRWWERH
jgi:hypothetical protein